MVKIEEAINNCFIVIKDALNDFKTDDTVRLILNNNKEFFKEIFQNMQEHNDSVLAGIEDIKDILNDPSIVKNNIDEIVDIEQIDLDNYHKNLLLMLSENVLDENYIQRKIYSEEDDEDSLTALLAKKQILLLSEAGYGKTVECEILVKKFCMDIRTTAIIPIFLQLQEYGQNYNSIFEAIVIKLNVHFERISKKYVESLLKNDKLALILDGLDDILNNEMREKCILDIKHLILNYNKTYVFITIRNNRYHNEFGNINKYNLTELDKASIVKKLQSENVFANLPESYYQLFKNPLLLSIGIKVMKNVRHRDLINRSVLFQELMIIYCGEWDKMKGIFIDQKLTYTELFSIIGKLAYEKYDQPNFSLIEFDKFIFQNVFSIYNKPSLIDFLLRTGIFVVNDTISFYHKLFKEFFAAYHLFENKALTTDMNVFEALIEKDTWQEVFIFYSGLIENLDEQNTFLDFIMENNLNLYIQCVNAMSDLNFEVAQLNKTEFVQRYLNTIVKTYTYILDKYFKPIKETFDPKPGLRENKSKKMNIVIVGSISDDYKHLEFYFDRIEEGSPQVLFTESENFSELEEKIKFASMNQGRSVTYHYINLDLSNLSGDSARKVTINRIKDELKKIFENRYLLESKYLLCERVENSKKRLKKIKNCKDLKLILEFLDNEITTVYSSTKGKNIVEIDFNGVELWSFHELIKTLISEHVDYEKCILPDKDINPMNISKHWIYELYSDRQLKEIISKYFYFHQISYIEMVMSNFPLLANNFSKYQDTPYKTIIYLEKSETPTDQYFQPSIMHFHIASESDLPEQPEIIETNDCYQNNGDCVFEQIRDSYLKQNKVAHQLSYTHTSLSHQIIIGRSNKHRPLSDYVYDSMKEGIEEIFGKI
ncbi:NACHT domain-containing protein [Acetobacterium carbinolicum]|uniref:NACHT domain-containing protein n=1 Tax=Acetobacterium carbinolicum TaxID=52690 RepID=UPI0039BF053D